MSRKNTAKLVLENGKHNNVILKYIMRNVGGKYYYSDDGDSIWVDGKPERVGVMVGIKNPNCHGYGVGFTLANISHGDKFEPSLGVGTAISRALGYQHSPPVPDSMTVEFVEHMDRTRAYFKDLELVNAPEL